VPALAPALGLDVSAFEHSPITGIHLWFDRPVMEVPHATLLDRTIQWAFNKGEGRYVQLVVSASRSLLAMSREAIIGTRAGRAARVLSRCVRGPPGEGARGKRRCGRRFPRVPAWTPYAPARGPRSRIYFLAGDWTRTGWPATMEGAVRSGYLAAEAVCEAAGRPERFVLCDN